MTAVDLMEAMTGIALRLVAERGLVTTTAFLEAGVSRRCLSLLTRRGAIRRFRYDVYGGAISSCD